VNFLYCFDENYNTQAFVSIYSLLQNVSEKINIFIIHKNKDHLFFPPEVLNHKNLNELNTYEYKQSKFAFPNIENTHVSEATYYRFFIDQYLPSKVETLIYLDADIVCVSDPLDDIKYEIKELKNSDFIISARLENESLNKKLKLKSANYFNAGVMIIDKKRWIKNDIGKRLVKITSERHQDLEFWDQDSLNILFDGNFCHMSKFLNFNLNMYPYENVINYELDKNVKFIHYFGKFKPWTLKGIENKKTKYYQNFYREIYKEKYHLNDNWKVNTIKDLFKIIFTGKILKIRYPFSLIFLTFQFLFRNKK